MGEYQLDPGSQAVYKGRLRCPLAGFSSQLSKFPRTSPSVSEIQLLSVDSRRLRKRFVDVPRAIYGADPAWVEPLRIERMRHLSSKNPFFEHASGALWIARRDGRDVGRISAQIDQLHIQQHGEQAGFFGMLDAEDNPETFAALFRVAEAWLRERGMQRVLGPFNFSINEDCGLLIDGFDTPPQVMMPHGRPYYPEQVEACGYVKEKDLFAYSLPVDDDFLSAVLARRDNSGVTLRPLSKQHMAREIAIVRDLFNDAWSNNWGFVAFTDAELQELSDVLKHFIPADYMWFAEKNGKPIGFITALPNLNEAIADMHGSLLPFNWVKLLWRLKVRQPKSVRVALLGLSQDMQSSLRGARVVFKLLGAVKEAFLKRGVTDSELSWVLEDNTAVRSIIGAFAADPYKRYRIYSKELSEVAQPAQLAGKE